MPVYILLELKKKKPGEFTGLYSFSFRDAQLKKRA